MAMFSLAERFNDYLGKNKPRYFGMGLLWAWIYCVWFTSSLFADAIGVDSRATETWTLSATGIAAILCVTPFFTWKRGLYHITVLRVAAPLMMSVGSLFIADPLITGLNCSPLTNISAFATGVGAGWLWIMWGEVYGNMDIDNSEAIIPYTPLLIIPCIVVAHALNGILALVFVMLLPLVSYCLLTLCFVERNQPQVQIIQKNKENSLRQQICRVGFWPEFIKVGIVAVVLHAVVSSTWILMPMSYYEAVGRWMGVPISLGVLLAIVISTVFVHFAKRPDICTSYRFLLPLVVISLGAQAFQDPAGDSIAYAGIMAVQFCYCVTVYVFFARISYQGWCPADIGLGLGRGFCQVGILIGTITAGLLVDPIRAGHLEVWKVCIVGIVLSVSVVLLLLNRDSVFDCYIDDQGNTLVSRGKIPASGDLRESIYESDGLKRDEARLVENCIENYSGDCIDSSSGEGLSISENDLSRSLSGEGVAFLGAVCQELACEFGLTPRETEVLVLLAQGRSLPYIRSLLYISKNTASTHVKRIYKKLGVHSRQELLDLVHSVT